MFCEQCGTRNLDTSKFCSECGARLVTYPVQSAQRLAPADKAYPQSEYTRSRHRSYSRIAAWIKQKYPARISGISDPYRLKSELEMIAGNHKSEIPAKTWAGFLEYLKKQNYEQLLK